MLTDVSRQIRARRMSMGAIMNAYSISQHPRRLRSGPGTPTIATRLDGPGAGSHYGAQPLLPQPACSQLGKASEATQGRPQC
jgi:hypothetical protein